MKTRIRIYVDALNFYYNVVSKVPGSKWLDLERCLHLIIQKHLRMDVEIERIKFFTSAVLGESYARQAIYHKALQAHSPNIEIQLGQFRKYEKHGVLKTKCRHCGQAKLIAQCPQCGREQIDTVKFGVYEEKQTDVNLATAMVEDVYIENKLRESGEGLFDWACLVSNDSDFLAALAILKKLGQRTILLPPLVIEHSRYKSAEVLRNMLLNPDRDCIRGFVKEDVGEYLLPHLVGGKFRMPEEWRV